MKKLISIIFTFIIIFLAVFGYVNYKGNSGRKVAAKPLVIARPYDVAGLDPGFLTENAQVVDNIFDTLVTRDNNEKLKPSLATSWKQIKPTIWRFKLRKGVKFTNGEKFTASSVKFSIDRVLNPKNNAPTASYISTIKQVKVVNTHTVDVVTKKPDPLIPTRFNRYPTEIVPEKYVKKVGEKTFSEHPIGTGAYKFVSWKKGESVTLKVNKHYWNGIPKVKKVIFKAIPQASTRIDALNNGEADIITGVSPEDRTNVQKSKTARLSTVRRGGNIVYVGFKTNVKPFNNVKVRRALNYAINKRQIVKDVLKNSAVATNSLSGPKDTGYTGEPSGYAYNPTKAKQLLKEAGYSNGFTATLDTVNWYADNTAVAQALAAQLKKVGVILKVKNIESSVYRSSVPAGKQSAMYVLGWSSTNTLDADAAMYAVLHSGEPYSTYSNVTVDKELDEARTTSNLTERKHLYASIEKTVVQDAPRIFLYQENTYYGVSKKINWSGKIDGSINVKDVSYIK
ncbi:hypothetical protein FC89_GL001073 [Liquorilactobacillus ghanensis DSM 18630]|uniref:Solute-binding protein family 5 domain-containing protein n=1 Tax=Liquorilactobacillus ghanensis DSM 18630 TaxID=1423750 RepID=A0A0R1VQQ7_9LACO|nr:ABC transporter substrate-binding protein [Liquorilactobacillus ghanensis]KRM06203.1 hypothetical protein FC89_GL001073 [Liquorilactobacillus ghanensis DSM 18630]